MVTSLKEYEYLTEEDDGIPWQCLLRKHFFLFHVNTRSLSKNFDQLLSVLSSSKINFDVIGISEIKQKTGMGFLVNVDINNYFMYTQPSKLV